MNVPSSVGKVLPQKKHLLELALSSEPEFLVAFITADCAA